MKFNWLTAIAAGGIGAAAGIGYALATGNKALLMVAVVFAVTGIVVYLAGQALDQHVFDGATFDFARISA